ncbi:MAG: FtsX-like permease family protein [Betaproteobacteria bacterium]|nr:FtsX-like permease family protein [Betaproteobacteria bacterium]
MATLRLALRMLLRDWRAGELRVLIAAMMLAVASVGTVGFFGDRVGGGLAEQANRLLGADLMVSGDRPLPAGFAEKARSLGLETSAAIRFNSMVQRAGGVDAGGAVAGAAAAGAADRAVGVDGNAVLTDVKAVSAGYPLRGSVTLVEPGNPAGRVARGIPPPGETWIDRKLADRLDAQVGSRLAVGDASLKVTAIIAQDPEVAGLTFAPGPKLLLNLADVPSTKLLQPGNRATWRLLVAQAGGGGLERFRAWLAGAMQPGQRVETVRELRPEVRQTLERAERFLGLAALVAVLLAAVAVALAASRYLRRHLDAAAMIRCFGAPVARTLALFVIQFLVLGLVSSAAGIACALAGQQLLVALVSSSFSDALPWPSWVPALSAFATGMLLLMGFALPPLVALARVPPLRVLRRDLPRPRAAGAIAYACGTFAIGVLIAWQAREAQAAWIVIGGVAGLLIAAAAVAWLLLALLKRIPQGGVSWRFGLANLRRRPLASSLQIAALALGLMSLLLLTVVRGDLLQNWRASLPPDAPNQFLVNVLPDQVDGTRALLSGSVHVAPEFKPMVRGRLVAVNGVPLDAARYSDPRARRLAEREFNLSWADRLPTGNRVAGGKFWDPQARGSGAGISLEDGIAKTLGVKVGDRLTFDAGGMRVDAAITSLRKVDWDSFRVNFFALFAPGALDDLPVTYIAAFRVPGDNGGWLSPLVRRYPNVLAIDVAQILHEVQGIIDRVARAIEFVFMFTLAGGVLVLQAAIASTQDERRHDAAVLRTLGASRRQLQSAQATEFVILGALAGLLAAAGAIAIGWALADRLFSIPFSTDPLIWVWGIGGGAAAVTLAGWLGTRSTLREPPLAVLRQLA